MAEEAIAGEAPPAKGGDETSRRVPISERRKPTKPWG